MIDASPMEMVRRLLPWLQAEDVLIESLAGGGNNRLYRITSPESSFVLKHYFQHDRDHRDRLASEFGFALCAWNAGIRCIPCPIACNRELPAAIFEYIDGHLPIDGEIGSENVSEAMAFIRLLQGMRDSVAARALPKASEACFSIADHLWIVDQRVRRLQALQPQDELDQEALALIEDRLSPLWREVRSQIRASSEPLPMQAWVISPSDFGFHNALVRQDGRTVFLDFEYAGWDDPAKLACDFFSQVAVPAPEACFEPFVKNLSELVPDPPLLVERIRILRPVYHVKWCCIVLNHFLPTGMARRIFADADAAKRRKEQLVKAKAILSTLS